MQNAGQGGLGQLLHGYPSANGMQPQLVCRFADAQHGYAFGGGKTVTGKRFQGILFSVVFAYHLQAGDAALHAVVLLVKGNMMIKLYLFLYKSVEYGRV